MCSLTSLSRRPSGARQAWVEMGTNERILNETENVWDEIAFHLPLPLGEGLQVDSESIDDLPSPVVKCELVNAHIFDSPFGPESSIYAQVA